MASAAARRSSNYFVKMDFRFPERNLHFPDGIVPPPQASTTGKTHLPMQPPSLQIPIPDTPALAMTAIIAYAGIAKRLQVELSNLAEETGIDLDAIKADLINEAKKAVPHGDFATDEIEVYNTMFQAIEIVFRPLD